jgi:hypothetical protein
MGREGKYGAARCVYLPVEWSEYAMLCKQKLGVSGSARLSELMLKDLAEMQGQTLPSQANIETLEIQLANLIARIKKLKAFLVKLKVYEPLEDLIRDWRLNVTTFANLDAITEKFLKYQIQRGDSFTRDDIELFMQFLSLVKQKTLRKNELDKLRLDRIDGVVTPVPVASADAPLPATTSKADAETVSVAVAPVAAAEAEPKPPQVSQPENAVDANVAPTLRESKPKLSVSPQANIDMTTAAAKQSIAKPEEP